MQNLAFRPNCMTYRHGFVAVGGVCGEMEVQCINTRSVLYKGSVAHGTINNALQVAATVTGDLQLFVCNNDKTIKIYSLPRLELLTTLRCFVPPNYSSMSPDGRFLCCVSDCSSTTIYQIRESGYELVSTFTEARDVGMSCGWSTSGSMVASAHQDGTVCLWDHKSGHVVFKSVEPQPCRALKFSPAPLDLLAVSYHDNRVAIMDARKWQARQVVNCLLHDEGAMDAQGVAGIAFSPMGRRLYVGLKAGLVVWDVDHCSRRSFGSGMQC